VVKPRAGVGEKRGMADRLSDRDAGAGGDCEKVAIQEQNKSKRFSDHAPLTIDNRFELTGSVSG